MGVISAHLLTDLSGCSPKTGRNSFPQGPPSPGLGSDRKLNCCSVDGLPTQSQSRDSGIVFKKAFHYEAEKGLGT